MRNVVMRRLPGLFAMAAVVGACAISSQPATEAISVRSADLSDCTAAQADIVVLCEAVDLIQRRYVDEIAEHTLVASALGGIAELPTGGEIGDLACDVDDAVVESICRAIDAAEVPPSQGVEAAMAAMAFALDPNSAYLDSAALDSAEADTAGQVEGIGALVNAEDTTIADPVQTRCAVVSDTCQLVVVSVFDGSPAQVAGVHPGDSFVSVDGVDVVGLHIDEVTDLVRGPAGSAVKISFNRGEVSIEFEIIRAAVDLPIAEWEMVGDIGYLRFNLFTVNSDAQVRRGLIELMDAGASGIIFDLRNNPGGALQAAVEVTSEFLGDGLVVKTQSPDDETLYEVTGEGVAIDPALPVWVLVNEGSASASEVMAGVLGETGRAVVIGANTYGKNTVQQRFPLGNDGAMKLTVARWVTPSGQDFGTVGITPGIMAELPLDMTVAEVVAEVRLLVG